VPDRIQKIHIWFFFFNEEDTLLQDPVGIELRTHGLDEKIARVKLGGFSFWSIVGGGGGGPFEWRK